MRFPRTKYNLSHDVLLSCNMGEAIPIGNVQVVRGDSFQHQTSLLTRVSPLVRPLMHKVDMRVHHFYVPYRLVWSGWEDFITGGADGNDTSTPPTVAYSATPANEPLLDYLGIKPKASLSGINAFDVRAYNMIMNTYYLDQDLATARDEDDMTIANISWEKDYFTTCRPWPQKGTAVTVGLAGTAPVAHDAANSTDVGVYSTVNSAYRKLVANAGTWVQSSATGTTSGDSFYADLSSATGIELDELKVAIATQSFMQLRARFGSEFVDYLMYYGIKPLDARLQRPEYLGGGKQSLDFSEVLATAEGTTTEVGDQAGYGIGTVRSNKYTQFFPEDGVVMSILSVRPKAVYNDGIPRKFFIDEKEQFYQKEFELVGQQEVYNKEVYLDHTTPDGVFGYNDKYSELSFEPSRVAGNFRVGENLHDYHMAISYSSDPSLNETFVTCTPTTRVYQATSEDQLRIYCHHRISAKRLLSRKKVMQLM
jgi:hypothetical protein